MRCLDYASTAQAAFLSAGGSWAKWSLHIKILLNTFLCLSQTGSNAVYILFVAHNTQHVGVSLREYYITFCKIQNWFRKKKMGKMGKMGQISIELSTVIPR